MTAPSAVDGLHALVLAAGAARRFGSAKQLFSIQGMPLLTQVASRAATLVGDDVIVVLGAHAGEIEAHLSGCPGRRLINPAWEEGIGSSLRAGVSALPPACAAVLVLLADQAAVSVADLKRLVTAWQVYPERIVAAYYGEPVPRSGVPAIFPRAWFPTLLQLTGDSGARALLARHTDAVQPVPMPSALLDIDTPEDAQRYLSSPDACKTR